MDSFNRDEINDIMSRIGSIFTSSAEKTFGRYRARVNTSYRNEKKIENGLIMIVERQEENTIPQENYMKYRGIRIIELIYLKQVKLTKISLNVV